MSIFLCVLLFIVIGFGKARGTAGSIAIILIVAMLLLAILALKKVI